MTPVTRKGDRHTHDALSVRLGSVWDRLEVVAKASGLVNTKGEPDIRRVVQIAVADYLSREDVVELLGAVEDPDKSVSRVLPDRAAGCLRELRSSGQIELLALNLAILRDTGWTMRSIADALGVSRQTVYNYLEKAE